MAEENNVSRELANRDLADIKELRASPAFARYWLRRLQQKRTKYEVAFRTEDGLTAIERESLRKLVNEYDDLLTMMAKDERAAESTVLSET